MFYSPLPRTLEAALRDLGEKKPEVRASAVRDLARHSESDRERVIGGLERALTDQNALVRATSAECLGELVATESLPKLLVAVEDEHQLVRQNAILALGELGDSRAQQRLERALGDSRPEVRFQAVMAYPRVASSRADAVAALLKATADEDENIAHIAFRMAEELAEDGGRVDEEILVRARECLAHSKPRVRAVAAVLLAGAKDPAADEALSEIVNGKLVTPEVADIAAAIELAGQRELPVQAALAKRAFGGLLGIAADPFQWHARVALARMGDARAKKAILAELGALSFAKRTLAVSAAGKARLFEARSTLLDMKGRPERAEPSAVEAALADLEETR
jgi:HEAT repeat protein